MFGFWLVIVCLVVKMIQDYSKPKVRHTYSHPVYATVKPVKVKKVKVELPPIFNEAEMILVSLGFSRTTIKKVFEKLRGNSYSDPNKLVTDAIQLL